MSGERVIFSRINERKRAYIEFFASLMNELDSSTDLSVLEARPDGRNWHHVARLPEENPHPSFLAYAFARGGRFRVELYIDTGVETRNKALFDDLLSRREEIEAALGEKVSWERLDGMRASRVAIYRDASIEDDADALEKLRRWAVPTMIEFRRVISQQLSREL